ncbi:hypothetical protein ZEAMMB73_Zm00001d020600 [Zea mays]|uniref:Uncharacterized protein n=1 Tax=Zea mays TaxID=4577 RepID=A0A1D6I4Z2_MAIZE|nr:hypothetical protein ZEAMMB73_Zm00001d020600 [Zea mays]
MEPVVLNRERAAADRLKRMPIFRLFDDYRDEDFYGLPRKYSIVARVEVKFLIEPRFRDRQHFILSDINGAKIEAITYLYETVKHFDNLLHEKHVYKMHNVKFGLSFVSRVWPVLAGHHRMFWALQYSCTNRGNPIAPVIKLAGK